MTQQSDDTTEFKAMMKQLITQLGTMMSFINTLVNKYLIAQLLKIFVWNTSTHKTQEIKNFLDDNNIDVFKIFESHCTDRSYVRISRYKMYCAKHLDGTANGRTAIIIKDII